MIKFENLNGIYEIITKNYFYIIDVYLTNWHSKMLLNLFNII